MSLEWAYEISFRANGETVVCDCDEAGRGPLAGPVVAAAVILPDGLYIEGLDDSKKLTDKKGKSFTISSVKAVSTVRSAMPRSMK